MPFVPVAFPAVKPVPGSPEHLQIIAYIDAQVDAINGDAIWKAGSRLGLEIAFGIPPKPLWELQPDPPRQVTKKKPQSTPPQPITSLRKKKRNEKTRLQYKRRSLIRVQEEANQANAERERSTVKRKRATGSSIPGKAGLLSTMLHQAIMRSYGDIVLPATHYGSAIPTPLAYIPTPLAYIRCSNDLEASGEG